MRKLSVFAIIAALSLCSFSAIAWNGPGHMIIAAGAYQELSPELKNKVTEILKSHPDYAKWQKSHAQETNKVDLALYVFMQAGFWPDLIHHKNNEYDHPAWHTIHYPLRPPDFPLQPAEKPGDNALFGIAECEKILSNPKASAELRAVYLSYLVHLVGDLHQPVHCGSLFTADFPTGDRGAYDFFVTADNKVTRLHVLWDGMISARHSPEEYLKAADEIESRHPRMSLPELAGATTPKAWSLEGRQLAIDKGYLKGELKGGTSAKTAPPVPKDYLKEARQVAEKQAALAGYRLADEINQFVK